MSHPPWLRFQAYLVGLPKTGSTSLATLFGNYRTAHEAGIVGLLQAGLPWRAQEIDESAFWELAGPRLTRPSLEMDSVTCHHLYAELLAQRFPQALFVHTIRDVGGWVTSLLDMILINRIAMQTITIQRALVDVDYVSAMTGQDLAAPWRSNQGDADLIPGAMRYWADHMQHMAQVLPAGRTLRVKTTEIAESLPALAALCAVPVETLRGDLTHANQTFHSLDRLSLYRDDEQIRAAYDRYCAPIMREVFPAQHSTVFTKAIDRDRWPGHCEAVRQQVELGIRDHQDQTGDAPTKWFRRGGAERGIRSGAAGGEEAGGGRDE